MNELGISILAWSRVLVLAVVAAVTVTQAVTSRAPTSARSMVPPLECVPVLEPHQQAGEPGRVKPPGESTGIHFEACIDACARTFLVGARPLLDGGAM